MDGSGGRSRSMRSFGARCDSRGSRGLPAFLARRRYGFLFDPGLRLRRDIRRRLDSLFSLRATHLATHAAGYAMGIAMALLPELGGQTGGNPGGLRTFVRVCFLCGTFAFSACVFGAFDGGKSSIIENFRGRFLGDLGFHHFGGA